MNLAAMMKQASQMQAKMTEMQAKAEATLVIGQAGAGLVQVTLTGKGDLKAIKIDPKLMDPTDVETLEDLILAACANAKAQADALLASEMSKLTGGLNLPPGLKLPF